MTSSQRPVFLRITSISSRTAPSPPRTLVVYFAACRTSSAASATATPRPTALNHAQVEQVVADVANLLARESQLRRDRVDRRQLVVDAHVARRRTSGPPPGGGPLRRSRPVTMPNCLPASRHSRTPMPSRMWNTIICRPSSSRRIPPSVITPSTSLRMSSILRQASVNDIDDHCVVGHDDSLQRAATIRYAAPSLGKIRTRDFAGFALRRSAGAAVSRSRRLPP